MDEDNKSRLETEKRSSQKDSHDDTQNFSFSPQNSVDLINKQLSEGASAPGSVSHATGNVTVGGPVIGLIALEGLDEIAEERKDDGTNPGSTRGVHQFEVNPINVALYDNDQN